jgi:gluconolactonase
LLVDRYLFDQPNGLCFCPTEKRLYVNDTVQCNIRVFDVQPDGSLANGRIFATGIKSELEQGVPDGMKCDQKGNVWVTAPGGVWVYSPSGDLIGKIRVPELVANLAWGGPDFRTLYMTATHSVYALQTKIGPRNEPYMRARSGSSASSPSVHSTSAAAAPKLNATDLRLDPRRCAMLIQDLQNDVIMDGGAFADSGAPAHARQQRVIENVRRVAEIARARGVIVIHVWFVVEPGAPGVTLNAPLFEGLVDTKAMERGGWGVRPAPGLEPQPGDFIVEKMRMSAWEGTRLETILKATGRDMLINTGAWTNMSIEHTARTGADKGYFMITPENCCSTMNAEWHQASINYALQNVSVVTDADAVIRALG